MQTANNVSEVVGVDVEDPADDDADGDFSFTTRTMEGPSRVISNDDNANPGNINTTKWRFISFVAFLVATVIIVVAISVGIDFDGGDGSTTTTVANNDSTTTTNMKTVPVAVPGKSSSLEPDISRGGLGAFISSSHAVCSSLLHL
jgi:hypothetical protein